jgi:hypothetical protein
MPAEMVVAAELSDLGHHRRAVEPIQPLILALDPVSGPDSAMAPFTASAEGRFGVPGCR